MPGPTGRPGVPGAPGAPGVPRVIVPPVMCIPSGFAGTLDPGGPGTFNVGSGRGKPGTALPGDSTTTALPGSAARARPLHAAAPVAPASARTSPKRAARVMA